MFGKVIYLIHKSGNVTENDADIVTDIVTENVAVHKKHS